MSWTHQEAVDLCIAIEAVCPKAGCHVALTGGVLYKPGARKDLDLLFYRIRQVEMIDKEELFESLRSVGIFVKPGGKGWIHKAAFLNGHESRPIDLFFPEEDYGLPY